MFVSVAHLRKRVTRTAEVMRSSRTMLSSVTSDEGASKRCMNEG